MAVDLAPLCAKTPQLHARARVRAMPVGMEAWVNFMVLLLLELRVRRRARNVSHSVEIVAGHD
jgi:hypothetical protein